MREEFAILENRRKEREYCERRGHKCLGDTYEENCPFLMEFEGCLLGVRYLNLEILERRLNVFFDNVEYHRSMKARK